MIASLNINNGELNIGSIRIDPRMSTQEFLATIPYGEYDEHRDLHSFNLLQHIECNHLQWEVIVHFKAGAVTLISIVIRDQRSAEREAVQLVRYLTGNRPQSYPWGNVEIQNYETMCVVNIDYRPVA